jgi:hypothetical protein
MDFKGSGGAEKITTVKTKNIIISTSKELFSATLGLEEDSSAFIGHCEFLLCDFGLTGSVQRLNRLSPEYLETKFASIQSPARKVTNAHLALRSKEEGLDLAVRRSPAV